MMLVTIQEAEDEMVCMVFPKPIAGEHCISYFCMNWRWHDKGYEGGKPTGEDRRGYCGLSGLPGKGEL